MCLRVRALSQDWDNEKREWFTYNLEEEAVKVQGLDEQGETAALAAAAGQQPPQPQPQL